MTRIVWFRRDLRLDDNPAWSAATRSGEEVVPLFVVDPRLWNPASQPRVRLLAASLRALDREISNVGGRLMVIHGTADASVPHLVDRFGATMVHANADHTPFARRRDTTVSHAAPITFHHGSTVHRPGAVLTKAGGRYRVFTPFHRAWSERPIEEVEPSVDAPISTDPGDGIPEAGDPPIEAGSAAALARLRDFDQRADRYPDVRDRPDLDATSRLSIDLKWGTISPRTILEHIGSHTSGRAAFTRQLAWRDFYADVMEDRPDTVDVALRSEYTSIAWNDDPDGLEAWKRGLTGFPIIDAGMRQLQGEGWIHNRVRMLVASFLVKDLLIDWRLGERFFRHHLLDGDVAQNVGNWQWAAGTGADAAPYFRIFNPITQSRKFDPDGRYIRRWVPELAGLDDRIIHAPWEAGPLELAAAGIVLGTTYPAPIVDHPAARERALARYAGALGG